MANPFDLPPLMHEAMRTGRMPSHAEIARATGKTAEEVARVLAETATMDDPETAANAEPEDPDEQKFRDKHRRLVDAMITDWYDDNPAAWGLPAEERERIEEHCRRQIEHERRVHRQRLAEEQAAGPPSSADRPQ